MPYGQAYNCMVPLGTREYSKKTNHIYSAICPILDIWAAIFISQRMSVLIWIQTVRHSDALIVFSCKVFFFKKKPADLEDNKSMKNYPACKELN